MEIEQIIKLKSQGYTYQEIADEHETTRSAVIGKMWRHNNPQEQKDYDRKYYRENKVKKKRRIAHTQIHVYVSPRVREDLENLAEKSRKPLSKFCYELIIDGYRYRKLKARQNEK